eukprot:PLAT13325.1.p2 GENE.PLAT13325.1~~PLAT13325.1.p2  ORF type:complete len:181 (+),score=90.29 PLAT13325.1:26-568(+)
MELSDDLAWVLFLLIIHAAQLYMVGGAVGADRKKAFSKNASFKSRVAAAEGCSEDDIDSLGYPDMGEGRYAAVLDHKTYMKFNFSVRAHYNFLEFFWVSVVVFLVLSVFQPLYARYAIILSIVGRAIYTGGYKWYGPRGRLLGALLHEVASFGSLLAALYYVIPHTGIVELVKTAINYKH